MNYELNMILEKISGSFVCVYEGNSMRFASKEEFEQSGMEKNCTVFSISTKDDVIVLELKKWESPKTDMNAEWVQEHKRKYGEEPYFF